MSVDRLEEAPLVRVLSLGAGVQSSTLYLMAVEGTITPKPDMAIFADTQWEPQAVYRHLAALESLGGAVIPIQRVTSGAIREAALVVRVTPANGRRYRAVSLPVYVVNPDGSPGTLHRQCTRDFKIRPIRRAIQQLLRRRGLTTQPGVAEQWIGISIDEVSRMKDSGVAYITNRWPLIEMGRDRRWCERWLRDRGIDAPKSACIGCPYRRDEMWRHLRDEDPTAWDDAVAFDRSIRHLVETDGENYLHDSRVPLDQVDLSTAEERGQINLWENECEGMCGV